MSKPFNVGDDNFEGTVLNADTPVLVDFWAPWCAPCRMIAPVVEELAEEFDGKISFAKLNCDENPGVPSRYNIRSIPTLIVFKGGEPVQQIVGLRSKVDLTKLLNQVLTE